jgi:ubiquinone/menaquinone biosynthesis C-methylase UbiE
MLERLAPARAQTILDLAAGVGVAGFAAAGLVGPDGRVIVSDFLTGSAGALAVVIDRLEDDERARVRHEIAGLEAPFAVGDGIELPALSLVASASSPGVAQVSRARPDPPRA